MVITNNNEPNKMARVGCCVRVRCTLLLALVFFFFGSGNALPIGMGYSATNISTSSSSFSFFFPAFFGLPSFLIFVQPTNDLCTTTHPPLSHITRFRVIIEFTAGERRESTEMTTIQSQRGGGAVETPVTLSPSSWQVWCRASSTACRHSLDLLHSNGRSPSSSPAPLQGVGVDASCCAVQLELLHAELTSALAEIQQWDQTAAAAEETARREHESVVRSARQQLLLLSPPHSGGWRRRRRKKKEEEGAGRGTRGSDDPSPSSSSSPPPPPAPRPEATAQRIAAATQARQRAVALRAEDYHRRHADRVERRRLQHLSLQHLQHTSDQLLEQLRRQQAVEGALPLKDTGRGDHVEEDRDRSAASYAFGFSFSPSSSCPPHFPLHCLIIIFVFLKIFWFLFWFLFTYLTNTGEKNNNHNNGRRDLTAMAVLCSSITPSSPATSGRTHRGAIQRIRCCLFVCLCAALLQMVPAAGRTGPPALVPDAAAVWNRPRFLPSDNVGYTAPVLVMLDCGTLCSEINDNNTEILIYRNREVVGVPYEGPFWIERSTTLTAVMKRKQGDAQTPNTAGELIASAVYVLDIIAREVRVHPPPGSFIGGVDVVVYASSPNSTLYASVNDQPREQLASFLIPITLAHQEEAGNRVDEGVAVKLTLWEESLGGLRTTSTYRYRLVPPTPPTLIDRRTGKPLLHPSSGSTPTVVLHHPTFLQCLDPLGNALPLTLTTATDAPQKEASRYNRTALDLYLQLPGHYTASCFYRSYHDIIEEASVSLSYEPRMLPAPVFLSPICNSTLLRMPVRLELAIAPGTTPRFDTAGGMISFATWAEGLIPDMDPPLQRISVVLQPTASEVTVRASAEPAENAGTAEGISSTWSSCTLRFVEPGSASTVSVYARTTCLEKNIPLGVCGTMLQESVARCLNLYNPTSVVVEPYSTFAKVRVTHLPADHTELQAYTHRLTACLNNSEQVPLVMDGQSAPYPGDPAAAFGWRMVFGSSAFVFDASVTAGTPALLEVFGPNASTGVYQLLDAAAPGCEALGTPAQEEEPMRVSLRELGIDQDEAAFVWFIPPLPGRYKLCVQFPGETIPYEVSSMASVPLTATGRPFPFLQLQAPVSCGGPVRSRSDMPSEVRFMLTDTANATTSTTTTVTTEESPTTSSSVSPSEALQNAILLYAVNAGTWSVRRLIMETTTHRPAIPLPPVSPANPITVISANLGAQSGISATCVFYNATNSSTAEPITYEFYQTERQIVVTLSPATPVTATNVLLTLKGSFQPDELIAIEVYQALPGKLDGPLGSPQFSTLATPSAGLEHRIAVPSTEWTLSQPEALGDTVHVFAVLNGGRVSVSPTTVALSTLALTMEPSRDCPSGFHYKQQCVCFGAVNKTAYLCDATADPEVTPPSSTAHPTELPPSEPTHQSPTAAQRVFPLLGYFALMTTIGCFLFYSMRKGGSGPATSGENVVIVDVDGTPAAADEQEEEEEEEQDPHPPVGGVKAIASLSLCEITIIYQIRFLRDSLNAWRSETEEQRMKVGRDKAKDIYIYESRKTQEDPPSTRGEKCSGAFITVCGAQNKNKNKNNTVAVPVVLSLMLRCCFFLRHRKCVLQDGRHVASGGGGPFFRITGVRLHSVQNRRRWEAQVATQLSGKKDQVTNAAAKRFERIYKEKCFTPVKEAFPILYGGDDDGGTTAAASTSTAAGASGRGAWAPVLSGAAGQHTAPAPPTHCPPDSRLLHLALLGPQNAGKTSLGNALALSSVGAVSGRYGCTKDCTRSIATVHATQLVILDTPGVFVVRQKHASARDAKRFAGGSARALDAIMSVDLVVLTLPAGLGFVEDEHKRVAAEVASRADARELPLLLAITMMDKVQTPRHKEMYFAMRTDLESMGLPIDATCEVSAKSGVGLVDFKDMLCTYAQPAPWAYYRHETTDLSPVDRVSETLRQAFLELLPHEIPHRMSHRIIGWTTRDTMNTEVVAEVFFDRPAYLFTFYSKLEAVTFRAQHILLRECGKRFHFVLQGFVSPGGVSTR
eukprot:gene3752-2648_t